MALAAEGAAANKEDFAEATKNEERLRKDGVKSAGGSAASRLQGMRTYHFKRPQGISGSAVFRVQLSKDGVTGAEMVSGDPALRSATETISALPVRGATPPGSDARVLRDGVVFCGKDAANCDFVLMTRTGLAAEAAPK